MRVINSARAIGTVKLIEIDIIFAQFRYEGEGVNEIMYLARGSTFLRPHVLLQAAVIRRRGGRATGLGASAGVVNNEVK